MNSMFLTEGSRSQDAMTCDLEILIHWLEHWQNTSSIIIMLATFYVNSLTKNDNIAYKCHMSDFWWVWPIRDSFLDVGKLVFAASLESADMWQ